MIVINKHICKLLIEAKDVQEARAFLCKTYSNAHIITYRCQINFGKTRELIKDNPHRKLWVWFVPDVLKLIEDKNVDKQ